MLEWTALARAEPVTRPARVDQPAINLVPCRALRKHLGVAAGLEYCVK